MVVDHHEPHTHSATPQSPPRNSPRELPNDPPTDRGPRPSISRKLHACSTLRCPYRPEAARNA
ncbi:hypothetical protein STRAU_5643 [Streptomyces aurantiacus JA 4570]|uniref:Uncharacterized protein n=1 Tax=Streptomyces aurantiacus JA 4570 TaxID=1286094 RepID=S3ZS86_9ACTN|nr:hypothetical protein STRAU_5643 [Streptomyces aurantiacus JA 4570]